MLTVPEIKERLQNELTPHRYAHSLGVADTAKEYAAIFGEDVDIAYLAGLLHDCGKPYADALSHAEVGAKIAHENYGIEDESILNAIKYHTIGHVPMTLLEKIIFVADMTEPTRDKIPNLNELRATAKLDLDKAIVMCIEATMAYLKKEGHAIDGTSLEVYNYYKR